MITSLREDMQGTVQYVGSTSDPFPIKSGVKQGCVLAPTAFGMFFFLLLLTPSASEINGVYLNSRSDGNLIRFLAKTKIRKVLVGEMLP